jgi:hypothetical protein
VYEIHLNPHITTPFTRLLKFVLKGGNKPTFYSIMLGLNGAL